MASDIQNLQTRFPIARILSDAQREEFDRLVDDIANHPNVNIAISDSAKMSDIARTVAQTIAAHMAEVFFFRRDILERFLRKPKRFRLYDSAKSFSKDGGVGGGCYQPKRVCIQLVASRLTEGFGGETPGVAPFLHEFGHMLDHFNPRTGGTRKRCDGLLPGLHPNDGEVFTPNASALFIEGKRIERERYLRWKEQTTQIKEQKLMPIGHPYVFQNDGEFCAGYFEMFFRNPNYFAKQNETLFRAYVELFKWDPRRAWQNDFAYYVEQNRAFYLSGQPLWETRLTIPQS
jgi:hypothetical protein